MVTIRLARTGAKKRPFFHMVVTDKRMPQGGRYIERIGFFNPGATSDETDLRIDLDRIDYWCSKGAQMTDRAASLIKDYRKKAEASQAEAA